MRPLALLLLLTACGSGTSSSGDGGTAADLALPASGCQAATDCRLFSSYCSTAPCQCLALGRGDPDPPCTGTQMTCLVDPCTNQRPGCSSGRCVVLPPPP